MLDLLLSLLGDVGEVGEVASIAMIGVIIAVGILTAFPVMYLCDIIASFIRGLFKIK